MLKIFQAFIVFGGWGKSLHTMQNRFYS